MPDTLLVEVGRYRIGEQGFALDQPGVHRFYSLGGETVQRLVRPPDPESLLRHVGWLWGYGSTDEGEPAADDLQALGRAPRFLGCSRLAFLAVRLFGEAGLPARVAGLATAEVWNGHDDGHTLAEVMLPDIGWVAYDPGFHGFPAIDGRRVPVLEWVDAVREGAAADWLPLPGNPPLAPFRHSGFDYGPWVAERALSADALKAWYRRLAGTTLQWWCDRFYACADQVSPEALPFMAASNHQMLERRLFLDLFYSPAPEPRLSLRSPPP
ncbi:transglutaminase domain-containing protein [Azospirillum himalayense]|uniref:Transglutaminase domain-containing protein n=1 Tax=Azospirillum himalayense TaxID=654847 RepID=A0ABW0G226_9PROT